MSETVLGVDNAKSGICYWRASEASETVLGVDNAKSGMLYVARGTFFSKKHVFLGLTPVYSETTALSKPYFILKRRSVRKFLRKRLLFKKQQIATTCYYGIEIPYQI